MPSFLPPPQILEELRDYLDTLLGSDLAKKYLKAISTPMEEYALHIFQELELAEEIIERNEEDGFKANLHKDFPNLIITQPKGPFEVKPPEESKEIIVDNRAAEMIYQGSDVFVPGVKRANKVKENDLVSVRNQKEVLVAKAKALMNHNTILSTKKGIAAKNIDSYYKVPSIPQQNLEKYPIYFHSIPAYLTSLNLEPQKSENILDCCAAPGNKTIHLSELSKGTGKIVAVDRSRKRLNHLNKKISKFKIKNIEVIVGNIIELSKEWNAKFDKILIDPPCTALGLRPRLVLEINKNTIKTTAEYQKAILYACNQLLKPGGEMVYSTCTITEEENEGVIERATELGLKIEDQKYELSQVPPSTIDSHQFMQRFIPGRDKTLGYFIAKLKKPHS